MDGHKDRFGKGGIPWSSSHLIEPDRLAKHGLGCCCAKADEGARPYHRYLRFQPWPAGGDFCDGRLFVLATLALWFPFKMLHRICDIQVSAGDAGFNESLVQHLARWAHKRMACQVFLIAWLLADEHDRSAGSSLPKNGLGGALVQVAPGAFGCRRA